jgi:Mrp family chromosome partitioning ATPase
MKLSITRRYPHLDVILSGPVPPSELIMSDGMSELIEELKKTYDYIIWIRHQWDWFLML